MKIKLDENMPSAMLKLLRERGYDVASVLDEALSGADDTEVIRAATSESRVLITFDVDFGNVRAFPPGSHAGVVVFRLHDQRWTVLEEPAQRMLDSGILDTLQRGLAVIDESRIRIGRRAVHDSTPNQ